MESIKCQEKENRFEDLKFQAGYSQNYFCDITNHECAYSKSHWSRKQQNNS